MSLDPNQPYVPVPYPRMLFVTAAQAVTVHSEAEEAEARAAGYGDFAQIDAAADGLDVRTHEELIDIALRLTRTTLARLSKEDLIAGVRAMREREAEVVSAVVAAAPVADEPGALGGETTTAPDFDAMDDDALRAFIKARDGRAPHPATSHDKLLLRARGAPDAGDGEA